MKPKQTLLSLIFAATLTLTPNNSFSQNSHTEEPPRLNPHQISQNTLRIGIDNWAPFEYMDKNGNPQGLAVEVLLRITQNLQKQGFKLEWTQTNWPRGLKKLENSELDVLLSGRYLEERKTFARYTQMPIGCNTWTVYTQNSENNTKQKILGKVIGYAYPEEILESFSNIDTIYEVPNDENLIQMIQKGRISHLITEENTLKRNRHYTPKLIKELIESKIQTPLYALFSKGLYPEIFNIINAELTQIHQTGEIDKIWQKYGLTCPEFPDTQ